MPEAAIATPPATETPSSPSISTPAVVPPSVALKGTETRVSQMPKPAEPKGPPPAGSARAKMFEELKKSAKAGPPLPPEPEAPKPKPDTTKTKPEGNEDLEAAPGDEPTEGDEPGLDPEQQKPAEQPKPDAAAAKPGKQSPWKLLDQYKERVLKAEARVMELEKGQVPEADRKGYEERLKAAETRAKELEDEIRYVNYSKSKEFVEQYQTPYEQAWQRATAELAEIPVTDPGTGEPRGATAQDLLSLVNMPLGQAREVAEQVFGKFANDIMAHRKEILGLFQKQQTALEDAKKNGAEREKQLTETQAAKLKESAETISKAWTKINEEYVANEKFGSWFKPKEGDEDWNTRLKKGFELVDRAFSENPRAAKTEDERNAIIRRHVAVRNRAAAYGALFSYANKVAKELEAAKKELEAFKDTEPPTTGREAAPQANGSGSARDRMMADLNKIARPGR